MVDGSRTENRYFFTNIIGSQHCEALFNQGAMISVISTRVAESYNTSIRSAIGDTTERAGILKLNITVDGHTQQFDMNVLSSVTQDIILGVDFCIAWKMDVQMGPGLWRIFDGEWHSFNNADEVDRQKLIFAEWFVQESLR